MENFKHKMTGGATKDVEENAKRRKGNGGEGSTGVGEDIKVGSLLVVIGSVGVSCSFHNFLNILSKREDVCLHILYILEKTGRNKSSPIIFF